MPSKENVRRKFISIRKRRYFSVDKNFFKPLIQIINKKKKRNIYLYYPSNYEVDTFKLFDVLRKMRKISTSLPVIFPNGKMKFVKWKLNEILKVNHYGFLEPAKKNISSVADLILVPLVAYDRFHNRLGYGEGYYDRFIKKYKKNKKNLLTIGIAFSFQKYKKIPTSRFDEKLDYILTEKGIF